LSGVIEAEVRISIWCSIQRRGLAGMLLKRCARSKRWLRSRSKFPFQFTIILLLNIR
jgi:hypothetical protein